MKVGCLLGSIYGQLRGYDRISIRREVALSSSFSSGALAARSDALFRMRVNDARRRFPAYAKLVEANHGEPPVLDKHSVREILENKGNNFPSDMISHSTGGSTGVPFRFFITRDSFEWRTAVSDRGYSWAKAEEGRRSFYVWGTPIQEPGWKQRAKAGFHHWVQNRKYFDSFHFDDEQKTECCRQINRYKPVALVGYSGNLIELARFVSRNPGMLTWRARTAVTAAEGLRPGMRQLIKTHLADDVFMSYGSREFMLIGMECSQHEGYHIASDNVRVEVLDDYGACCPPDKEGRIVVTDLHNDATPFVRYEIGDTGTVGADKTCPCGLPFPLLRSVEGRLQEVVELADGEKLTALFIPHLMKEFAWVDGYQVVQEAPGHITMHLVTSDPLGEKGTYQIKAELLKKLKGNVIIGFKRVSNLEKAANGKTPIVLKGMQ